MNLLAPEAVHQRLLDRVRPALSFDSAGDVEAWREQLASKLSELVGVLPEPATLDLEVEWSLEHDGYSETRFVFTSEPGARVPCHLLVPSAADRPVPVVVCLQGHTEGMHVSLGRAGVRSMESAAVSGDRDFAIQAVRHGWAALAIEQRCFGERTDARPSAQRITKMSGCHHASHVASLLGRTMVGERTWEVSRAIDTLATFSEVDTSRIACMGNSGGGVVAWQAACLDPRISVVMPSCSICTYRGSIASINHCCDNYLPGALQHFDMPDLAGLIAPRPLVVVAGRRDHLFPVTAVEQAFSKIQRIYAAFDAADRCALVIGDGGHHFYAGDAWPVFAKVSGWLTDR